MKGAIASLCLVAAMTLVGARLFPSSARAIGMCWTCLSNNRCLGMFGGDDTYGWGSACFRYCPDQSGGECSWCVVWGVCEEVPPPW